MLFRLLVPFLDSFKIIGFGLWPDDLTALVCLDSFSIRPRGGVSVSELSVNWCERTLTLPCIILRRDHNCNDAVEEVYE